VHRVISNVPEMVLQPPPLHPGQFNETALAAKIAARLAGKPADGSSAPPSAPPPSATTLALPNVVWADAGSEVLVHLDSVQVRINDGSVLVSVDFECDQTGRTPLVVVLAVGSPTDSAGLLAITDRLPRGNGMLAARWGAVLQNAVWAALLRMAHDQATEVAAAPIGISAVKGVLTLHTGDPLVVPQTVIPQTVVPTPGALKP